jgi:SAM-dependent MidA family methyltransferase
MQISHYGLEDWESLFSSIMLESQQKSKNTTETESSAAPLAERLRERIRREGAITFHDWMEAALYDERDGYYCRRDLKRWGRSGDYRTSPERSLLFAATFAGYFARLYEELGSPEGWTIFEAGAGEGHFAHGLLETLKQDYPDIFSATRYVIDERSADAHERIRGRLSEYASRVEYKTLPEFGEQVNAGVIFANELLDAFPVYRVKMRGGKLCELFVSLDDAGGFTWTERDPSRPQLALYLERTGVDLSEGQAAEINLGIEDWIKLATNLFKRGYLITVDYGAEAHELYGEPHRREGTLRAFRRHKLTDEILANPGGQDLTTTINWTHVRRAGEELGWRTVSFERQNEFLLRAGLIEWLEQMAAKAQSETDALILRTGAKELILPGGISEYFQVLVQAKGICRL